MSSVLSPEVIQALRQMQQAAPAPPQPAAPQPAPANFQPMFTVELPPQPAGTPFRQPQPVIPPTGVPPALAAPTQPAAPAQQPQGQPGDISMSLPDGRPVIDPSIKAGLGAIESGTRQAEGYIKAADKAQTDAGEKEKEALNKAAKAQVDQNDAIAGIHQEYLNSLQANQTERNDIVESNRAAYNKQLQLVQDMTQKYAQNSANQQGYFADKSIAQKLGWAVATALSGFGSALTHTPNGALQLLDSAIAEDTHLKERKMLGQNQAIEMERNNLAQLRMAGLDQVQAADANYLASAEIFKQRVQAEIAKTNDPIIKANGEKALAEIDQRIAGKKAELAGKLAETAQTRASHEASLLDSNAKLENAKAELVYKKQIADAGGNALHVMGFRPAVNKDDYDQLRNRYSAARDEVNAAQKLKGLFGTTDANGKFHPYGTVSALKEVATQRRLDQLVADISLAGARAISNRPPTDTEIKMVRQRIGIPVDAEGHVDAGALLKIAANPAQLGRLIDNFNEETRRSVIDYAKQTGQDPIVDDPFDHEQLDKFDPYEHYVAPYAKGSK